MNEEYKQDTYRTCTIYTINFMCNYIKSFLALEESIMSYTDRCEFEKNQPMKNYWRLLSYCECRDDSQIPVKSIVIHYNSDEAIELVIGGGSEDHLPSLALLLGYFAEHTIDGLSKGCYFLRESMRPVVEDYFGDMICNAARSNPQTQFEAAIRALLVGRHVEVFLGKEK